MEPVQTNLPSGEFNGKVALITGAGSGIGAATARLFASEGAKVGLLCDKPSELAQVADEIRSNRGIALELAADVTDECQVADAVRRLAAEWDLPHGLLRDVVLQRAGGDQFLSGLQTQVKPPEFSCLRVKLKNGANALGSIPFEGEVLPVIQGVCGAESKTTGRNPLLLQVENPFRELLLVNASSGKRMDKLAQFRTDPPTQNRVLSLTTHHILGHRSPR